MNISEAISAYKDAESIYQKNKERIESLENKKSSLRVEIPALEKKLRQDKNNKHQALSDFAIDLISASTLKDVKIAYRDTEENLSDAKELLFATEDGMKKLMAQNLKADGARYVAQRNIYKVQLNNFFEKHRPSAKILEDFKKMYVLQKQTGAGGEDSFKELLFTLYNGVPSYDEQQNILKKIKKEIGIKSETIKN